MTSLYLRLILSLVRGSVDITKSLLETNISQTICHLLEETMPKSGVCCASQSLFYKPLHDQS